MLFFVSLQVNCLYKNYMAKKLNTADLGFEDKIWKAADLLRGSIDAAEYKNVVLGKEEESAGSGFDLRQAIVYSTILRAKYIPETNNSVIN